MFGTSDNAMQTSVPLDETQLTENFLNAIRQGATKKVVFSTNKWEVVRDSGWALRRLVGHEDVNGESDYKPKRLLNVEDACNYLSLVKKKLRRRKDLYKSFLLAAKKFTYDRIDTLGLIKEIILLFKRHDQLVLGFNTFLPGWYHIRRKGKEYEQNEGDRQESSLERTISALFADIENSGERNTDDSI